MGRRCLCSNIGHESGALPPGTFRSREMSHQGSCHCGRVTYEVEGDFDSVLECNCSHCSAKGLLLWFVPREQLKLTTADGALKTYTFNKHVIQHQFCAECGCQPF